MLLHSVPSEHGGSTGRNSVRAGEKSGEFTGVSSEMKCYILEEVNNSSLRKRMELRKHTRPLAWAS